MTQRSTHHTDTPTPTHKMRHVSFKTAPAHTYGYRSPFIWKIISIILCAILVFAGTAGATFWSEISSTIENTKTSVIAQKNVKKEQIDSNAGKAINVLVLGIDSRDGAENQAIGGSGASVVGNHQSDTTMVVHISANRKFIDIVSIPRDSIVSVPGCKTSKGSIPAQTNVMFNSIFPNAYGVGGDLSSAASCTLSAVNALTGLSISQFITVDFSGLSKMISALGGVSICVPEEFSDADTHLTLKAGLNKLNGVQATQYARVRHGLGDGSDIMRTVRQQYLIKMLLREALSKNFFADSPALYNMAKVALQSLKMSDGLANLGVLVGLASSLKNIKTSAIYSRTVPIMSDPSNPNRVIWTDNAAAVWQTISKDQPLTKQATKQTAAQTQSSAQSSAESSSQSSQNATDDTTSQDNSASTQATQSDTPSSTTTDSNSSHQNSSQSTTKKTSQVNPHTGLIERADGTLVDPKTGGYVDKSDGTIRDPDTGWATGLAEKYVNYTFCHIES